MTTDERRRIQLRPLNLAPGLSGPPDLTRLIRPGDLIMVGQGCAEPLLLTRALVEQRSFFSGARVLLATSVVPTFTAQHTDHLEFLLLVVSSGTRALARTARASVLPVHYSDMEDLVRTGPLRPDVVVVQVSSPDSDGRVTLGASVDYVAAAIPHARVVIAEVNSNAPRTNGDFVFSIADFDMVVESRAMLPSSTSGALSAVEHRIGEILCGLIDDGSTLQVGVGGIPNALLSQLTGHRNLGFHSGMMSDGVADLMASGVIDNSRKGIDHGVSVCGVLLGTQKLFRFVDSNRQVNLRRPNYTHSIETLTRLEKLVSINSAIEVDLTGQVNSEALNGMPFGALGGQVDFVRGARRSGGMSVIALPSTFASDGSARIVAQLSGPVTTPRSDVDRIVTEWGMVALRGLSARARAHALISIAHPDHREDLSRRLAASPLA